jgi:hypothetical protein
MLALPGFSSQVIPSDAAKPEPALLHRIMAITCPGHVTDLQSCSVCPPESEAPNDPQGWQLSGIFFGHFTTSIAKEALVSTLGCNSHAAGMSGAFLLRDEGKGYQKIWYRPGYIATDCKKLVAKDSRDVLLCASSDMHQGVGDEFLYLLDLVWDEPQYPEQVFFSVTDSLTACVTESDGFVYSGHIEDVQVSPRANIRVQVRVGKARLPKKTLDNDCNLNLKPEAFDYLPVIRTVPLTFKFVFNGSKVIALNGNEPLVPTTSYFVPKSGAPVKIRR